MKLRKIKITDKPPYGINGLVSIQVVKATNKPDVTTYCLPDSTAIRLKKQGLWAISDHKWMIMADNSGRYDLYDRRTKNEIPQTYDSVLDDTLPSVDSIVPPTIAELEVEARECIGKEELSWAASTSSHINSSGASLGNYIWAYRKFIVGSLIPELENIFVTESYLNGGRTSSIMLDWSVMNPTAQDLFLDNRESLINNTPIDKDFHIVGLSQLWAHHSKDLVAGVVESVSDTKEGRRRKREIMESDDASIAMLITDLLHAGGSEYVELHPVGLETISPEFAVNHTDLIMEVYRGWKNRAGVI